MAKQNHKRDSLWVEYVDHVAAGGPQLRVVYQQEWGDGGPADRDVQGVLTRLSGCYLLEGRRADGLEVLVMWD